MRDDRDTVPGRPTLLRMLNDRLALDLLLESGPLTRQQVSDRTGLSRPTATAMLGRLESDGLVTRAGTATPPRGPGAAAYAVPSDAIVGAALDLRRDHAHVQVLDVTGAVLGGAVVDHDPAAPAWWTVRDALAAACGPTSVSPAAVRHVVVGVGAAYDPRTDALADGDRLPGWAGPGLAAGVADRLGLAVRVENDVNLALVAERAARTPQDGAEPLDDDATLLLWFGDGVGLAVEVGGAVHVGAAGRAGELGYVVAPPPLGDGQRDVQSVLGGPGLAALGAGYGVLLPARGRTVERPHHVTADGAAVVGRAVALARSEERGRGARALLADICAELAAVLDPLLAALDPGAVVLGGPGGTAGGAWLARLTADALAARSRWDGRVLPALAGTDAVLAGARVLAARTTRDLLHALVGRGAAQVAT